MPDEGRVHKFSFLNNLRPVEIQQPEKHVTRYFNWNIELTFQLIF